MKKIKNATFFALLPMLLGSCVVASHHHTTGNPIGTKQGFVKSKLVGNFDIGISAAAKAGGIKKIGSVDVKYYSNGKISVTVTGE